MKQSGDRYNKIFLPRGFLFSALPAGIKASGGFDLALVECCAGTRAAAVFTKNRVIAAPVLVGRASLKANHGGVRALIVNSGNANCANGKAGLRACQRVCEKLALSLGVSAREVFPASTGIIGVAFPEQKILTSLPDLIKQRQATDDSVRKFARAIMTTDTQPKMASMVFQARKAEIKLLGVAKGSGMIHPDLATMLVYLFTDLAATSVELKGLLAETCDHTFNCISVDGDTSTNDTVLLLASGTSGTRLKHPGVGKAFQSALLQVCQSLAEQIVSDGEGVQHVIRLVVQAAKTRQEAMQVARAIAHSPLVKTAWAGADPNWGRILSTVGNSAIAVNPARINIFIGNQQVCRNGQAFKFDEHRAHLHLLQPHCDIRVELGRGRSALVFYTTDLTAEYVRINADYST